MKEFKNRKYSPKPKKAKKPAKKGTKENPLKKVGSKKHPITVDVTRKGGKTRRKWSVTAARAYVAQCNANPAQKKNNKTYNSAKAFLARRKAAKKTAAPKKKAAKKTTKKTGTKKKAAGQKTKPRKWTLKEARAYVAQCRANGRNKASNKRYQSAVGYISRHAGTGKKKAAGTKKKAAKKGAKKAKPRKGYATSHLSKNALFALMAKKLADGKVFDGEFQALVKEASRRGVPLGDQAKAQIKAIRAARAKKVRAGKAKPLKKLKSQKRKAAKKSVRQITPKAFRYNFIDAETKKPTAKLTRHFELMTAKAQRGLPLKSKIDMAALEAARRYKPSLIEDMNKVSKRQYSAAKKEPYADVTFKNPLRNPGMPDNMNLFSTEGFMYVLGGMMAHKVVIGILDMALESYAADWYSRYGAATRMGAAALVNALTLGVGYYTSSPATVALAIGQSMDTIPRALATLAAEFVPPATRFLGGIEPYAKGAIGEYQDKIGLFSGTPAPTTEAAAPSVKGYLPEGSVSRALSGYGGTAEAALKYDRRLTGYGVKGYLPEKASSLLAITRMQRNGSGLIV